MFSSLRSRLWLTYAIAISSALLVVALSFVLYLLDNPAAYRQTRLELASAQALMLLKQSAWANLPPKQLQNALVRQAGDLNVRILIISPKRKLLADSQAGKAPALEIRPLFRLFPLNKNLDDALGQPWLYIVRKLDNGNLLITAAPRQKVSFWNIFTDELMPTLVWGGSLGMILALILAYWMSRWVSDPLRNLVTVTQEFSGSQAAPLTLKGPREVQDLASAFNQMTTRVQVVQKAQRKFVADVSHELKTPLTSIQGFSQALLDGTAATPQDQLQAARVIYAESERMRRLVLDLLDLAQMDSGLAELKPVPLDLAAILASVGERFALRARQASISLEIQAAGLPEISADGDRLAQVFSILVDNALKFTPANGRVAISAVSVEDAVEIRVSDSGAGIPPEALPRIFDRFYQVDASRRGGEKHGSGLGLAIAQDIIHAHGGDIRVNSTPGKGSEFILRLPLVASNPPIARSQI